MFGRRSSGFHPNRRVSKTQTRRDGSQLEVQCREREHREALFKEVIPGVKAISAELELKSMPFSVEAQHA